VQARSRGTARAGERLGRLAGGSWNAVLTSAPPSGELQVLIVHAESADDAARRARDAVVGDLAHELTTPLAAQAASLELLRERLAERDREALDLVLALEAGTFRLRRMIDNLLESVRIEAGQLAIRRLAVDLDEVVEESVALTQPLLERRGQRLELDLPHPMPPLTGDPQRLTQVLVNLLANASKFGPEASTVRLAVRQSGAAVELTVDDEGPGLDPATANAPRRFVRGGVEPPEPGSGLGLWICRSILERHGGGLRVEPRARGARLVASLPAGAA
jgi:signal transduction histidine kinase